MQSMSSTTFINVSRTSTVGEHPTRSLGHDERYKLPVIYKFIEHTFSEIDAFTDEEDRQEDNAACFYYDIIQVVSICWNYSRAETFNELRQKWLTSF